MAVPVELRYTAQHEWVLITDKVARIGITDYAQDALGDVVFVGVPTLGGKVVADQCFGHGYCRQRGASGSTRVVEL